MQMGGNTDFFFFFFLEMRCLQDLLYTSRRRIYITDLENIRNMRRNASKYSRSIYCNGGLYNDIEFSNFFKLIYLFVFNCSSEDPSINAKFLY